LAGISYPLGVKAVTERLLALRELNRATLAREMLLDLPEYDNLVLSHADRTRVIAETHEVQITANG
jgi:hypothetical protein